MCGAVVFVMNQSIDVNAIRSDQSSDPILISEMRGVGVQAGGQDGVAVFSDELDAVLGVERNVVVVRRN